MGVAGGGGGGGGGGKRACVWARARKPVNVCVRGYTSVLVQ